MQEDIFDIVDEFDNVIGQKPRSEVHAQGLKHRAVHVLVFNDGNEIFMQKRSASKDTWPGAWDASCTGHVDTGETYLEAAHRELDEELGWQPDRPLEKLFKLPASKETGWEFVWIYRVQYDGPFQLHPDEIECGDWFSRDHIQEWLQQEPEQFASAFRLLWIAFLKWETHSRNPA